MGPALSHEADSYVAEHEGQHYRVDEQKDPNPTNASVKPYVCTHLDFDVLILLILDDPANISGRMLIVNSGVQCFERPAFI